MKKRTLGCICDHGTTECKDIISLCDAHRGYCGVYVCNKGLQEILRLTALNDAQSMAVSKVHISSLYVIAIVSRGCRKLTQVNSEIPFNANNQDGKMSEGQMGESSKYFTPPAPLNNRGEDFSYIHLTTRFFGLRPLNDGSGLQEILRLMALNDAMNCHCERSEAIQFLGRGMGVLTGLPRHCVARNDGATTRFFGLRPLNDDRCRNMIRREVA